MQRAYACAMHGGGHVARVQCVVHCFFFQAEDGIRDYKVTGVQTCALPISHYWSRQDAKLIVGGEDTPVLGNNFRAPPDLERSVARLSHWCGESFPRLAGRRPRALHYSVYGETRDNLPILGRFSDQSRIWYAVGDNGDGQSTLSCITYLLPLAMALARPTVEEEALIAFQ